MDGLLIAYCSLNRFVGETAKKKSKNDQERSADTREETAPLKKIDYGYPEIRQGSSIKAKVNFIFLVVTTGGCIPATIVFLPDTPLAQVTILVVILIFSLMFLLCFSPYKSCITVFSLVRIFVLGIFLLVSIIPALPAAEAMSERTRYEFVGNGMILLALLITFLHIIFFVYGTLNWMMSLKIFNPEDKEGGKMRQIGRSKANSASTVSTASKTISKATEFEIPQKQIFDMNVEDESPFGKGRAILKNLAKPRTKLIVDNTSFGTTLSSVNMGLGLMREENQFMSLKNKRRSGTLKLKSKNKTGPANQKRILFAEKKGRLEPRVVNFPLLCSNFCRNMLRSRRLATRSCNHRH